jgi:hypothetical protein
MTWRSSWRSSSGATKAAVAVLQRIGKVNLEGEVCPWCKIRPADEVDHIEARANGGANSAFNGMWICGVCNRRKSARPLEDWIDLVRVPRPNPVNAFNAPMMLYDSFSNDRIIQYRLFGCRRMG